MERTYSCLMLAAHRHQQDSLCGSQIYRQGPSHRTGNCRDIRTKIMNPSDDPIEMDPGQV